MPRANIRITSENFWDFVDRSSGTQNCWPWRRGTLASGYGNFRTDGKLYLTHRYSWFLANGDIPEGKHVLHRCDNPICVNPGHLFLGTQADNNRDRNAKGRTISPRGEDSGVSVLTDSAVRWIRYLRSKGATHRRIAEIIGCVSRRNVATVCSGQTWKHILSSGLEV